MSNNPNFGDSLIILRLIEAIEALANFLSSKMKFVFPRISRTFCFVKMESR